MAYLLVYLAGVLLTPVVVYSVHKYMRRKVDGLYVAIVSVAWPAAAVAYIVSSLGRLWYSAVVRAVDDFADLIVRFRMISVGGRRDNKQGKKQ